MDKDVPDKGSLKRRVVFRLDDGSIFVAASRVSDNAAPDQIVRVPFEQALEKGLSGEAQVAKLESYLSELSTLLKPKHEAPQVEMPSAKKARSGSQVSSGPAGSGMNGVRPQADFTPKCMDIWRKTVSKLGTKELQDIFLHPVPDTVANYYNVIKRPMWLNRVKDKLENCEYLDPQGFYDDMRLIWDNCRSFNPPDDFVAKLGEKGRLCFETLWIESGLARAKRATAGVAASKFEPDLYTAPAQPKPSRSQQPARRKSELEKAGSHEVTSAAVNGYASHQPGVSAERIQEIANQLTQLDADQLQGLLPYIQMYYSIEGDGEFELDWENMQLDMPVMVNVDRYLRQVLGSGPEPSHNPSVQLDSDGAESEPDSE
jgi:hypothetical protein